MLLKWVSGPSTSSSGLAVFPLWIHGLAPHVAIGARYSDRDAQESKCESCFLWHRQDGLSPFWRNTLHKLAVLTLGPVVCVCFSRTSGYSMNSQVKYTTVLRLAKPIN
jgi:hypothetical protein